MKPLKSFVFFTLLLTIVSGVLITAGWNRYCYNRSLQTPLPNRWASLSKNYDAVSADVQHKFPEITNTGHYDWSQGYVMDFVVQAGTTPARAQQIVDYARPRWVEIREWAGMGQHADECSANVYGTDGQMLTPH